MRSRKFLEILRAPEVACLSHMIVGPIRQTGFLGLQSSKASNSPMKSGDLVYIGALLWSSASVSQSARVRLAANSAINGNATTAAGFDQAFAAEPFWVESPGRVVAHALRVGGVRKIEGVQGRVPFRGDGFANPAFRFRPFDTEG